MTDTTDLTPLAEGVECEFMYAYESRAPEPAYTDLGVATTRIGGGVALAMRNDPSGGYWSKALGFGVTEPFTVRVLDRVLDFYREQGVDQAVLQLVPAVLPDGFDAVAAARGLEPGSTWVKLAARSGDVAAARTRLRVAPVPAAEARRWADVLLAGFGMPAGGLTDMLASTVGEPAWRPHAAWDGDEVVAGGNLFLHGESASLNAAATAPGHRGLGAQSALIAARARAAAEAGCRWLFAETGKPTPGTRNPSLDNLRRAGLVPLYERRNWVWRSAP
ncbi:GNAT family N-acetyltransferase [Micromonospora sp. NPDC049101]|uniref:GNAT family N-acetyltransferase n=1 Tax=Micromonospora sp. NPDC049101 TaxID=3155032 RepID=UPI00340C2AF5